jgi:hypothetical protein
MQLSFTCEAEAVAIGKAWRGARVEAVRAAPPPPLPPPPAVAKLFDSRAARRDAGPRIATCRTAQTSPRLGPISSLTDPHLCTKD